MPEPNTAVAGIVMFHSRFIQKNESFGQINQITPHPEFVAFWVKLAFHSFFLVWF